MLLLLLVLMSASATAPRENGERAVVGHLEKEQAFRRVRVAFEAQTAAEELRHLVHASMCRIHARFGGWGLGLFRHGRRRAYGEL